jgi:hypothetical protein
MMKFQMSKKIFLLTFLIFLMMSCVGRIPVNTVKSELFNVRKPNGGSVDFVLYGESLHRVLENHEFASNVFEDLVENHE